MKITKVRVIDGSHSWWKCLLFIPFTVAGMRLNDPVMAALAGIFTGGFFTHWIYDGYSKGDGEK